MIINVYLIFSEINGKKLHKIGYTKRTIEKRIKEFKTGNASEFSIIDSFQSEWGTKIEATLHRIYSRKKLSGEWFDLNEQDIKEFKENCKKIHENFEIITKTNTYYLDKGDF
jgi:hypothetical protein